MNKRAIGNIQELAEGKYLLRFSAGFDDFGKRIQISKTVRCSSHAEAERLLMEFYTERERRRDERTTSAPETLGELYNEWMDNHVSSLASNTRSFYETLWDSYLKEKGKIKLKTLRPKHIYSMLEVTEKARTKNALFKMLKAMLNKGVKWGYIAENVCDRMETPKYKATEKQTLQKDDISIVMQNIGQEELKYQAMFYFAALCGLRRQEIIGFKWSDFDFAENTFQINRATAIIKGRGTVPKDTKTLKSVRKMHMPDILRYTLLCLHNEQEEQRRKVGNKWHDGDWVFTTWDGGLMNLHTPTNWWRDFTRAHDITPISFHGLRHTAATYMIKNNVPISTVSGVLGHSNVSTTLNIYTHVIEDSKKEAINIMENVFSVSDNNVSKEKKNLLSV